MVAKIKCRSISKARIIQIVLGTTYNFTGYNTCPICKKPILQNTTSSWTHHMITTHRYIKEINQAIHIWQLIKWDCRDFDNDLELKERVQMYKLNVTTSWKGAIQ